MTDDCRMEAGQKLMSKCEPMTRKSGAFKFMLQSKLSQRVMVLVFLLVFAIEGLLIYTLTRDFEQQNLRSLEQQAQTAFTALFLTHPYEMPDKMLVATAQMLLSGTTISGGIIQRENGDFVGQFGEPPAPVSRLDQKSDFGRRLSVDKSRYDVLWSASEMGTPFTLHVRLDSTRTQLETEAFAQRAIVITLAATLIITLGALGLMGPLIFAPLARLRGQVGLPPDRAPSAGDEWRELHDTVIHHQQRPRHDGPLIEHQVEERTTHLRDEIARLNNMGAKLSRLAALTEGASTPILRLTPECQVLYANGPARTMLSQWGASVGGQLPPPWSDRIASFLDRGTQGEIEEIVGDHVFLLNIVPTPEGDAVNVYGYDITARKKAEISRQTDVHDAFRGVNGRSALEERLSHGLALSQSTGNTGAVHILRVDGLDDAAADLDYDAALQLMRDAMARLRATVGSEDSVIRLGRAMFGVVQEHIAAPVDAMEMAECLMAAIAEPFHGATHTVRTASCIGISTYPDDGVDAEQLVRNAEMALDHAISEGPGTVRFFVARLNEQLQHRRTLTTDLRAALTSDDLVLHYQARLSLRSCRISGAEALIRWNHGGRLLLPEEFIPLAESCDVGPAIGQWVLRNACAQHREWLDKGFPHIPVSINVSSSMITSGNLLRAVEEALQSSDLPAELLELELPEGLIMADPTRFGPALTTIHDMGVRLSLDGFGTGYSSMDHLSGLVVDRIKIDPMFVTKIGTDPHASRTVRAAAALAHGISMKVTAVGVETSDQVDFLQTLPVDEVQGYAFAAPMDAHSFRAFVDNFTEATVSFSPTGERAIGTYRF
jgi:EAL domain-containing protein (putative c-di-GMP-specific phosphodiesterase class I)/GGDEF domain-containing protein